MNYGTVGCGSAAFVGVVWMVFSPVAAFAQPLAPEPFEPDPQVQTRVIRSSGGMMGSSFLGVGVQEVDDDRAKVLKLKEEAGVEVTRIEEDSPAAKAGLKVGDVILQFGGQRVEGIEQFSRFVRETPAGREIRLLVSRDGNTQTVVAKIATRKGMTFPAAPMPRLEMPPMPDMPGTFMMWRSSMLGVEGEALKGQLADFFGAKEGVLVRSVLKDTAAERAGIKAGDVILKVNDVKVASPGEISGALRSLKGKTTVPVMLLRDHKEMTVNATIDAEKPGWGFDPPAIRMTGRGNGFRL